MTYTEEMTASEILLRLASMRNELLQAVNDIEKISKNICYKAEQTENSSEKTNNSTSSKMEQVDKDINVRSKDERQRTKENCKGCKYNEYPYDSGTCFVRVCINGNKYEPKDEPQTDCAWR